MFPFLSCFTFRTILLGTVGGDCVFEYSVIDIIFWYVCLVLSTGGVKNKHQEQSIYVYIFHHFSLYCLTIVS